jgi:hypothetical protein
MALTVDEANAVSSKYFDKTITSQAYDTSPLWTRLKSKNKVSWDGGTQIQFPIRYRELGLASAVSPRSQISYQQKETRTAGVLDWAYYVVQGLISWDERAKNAGKAQIINLIKDKTDEMNQDLFEKFADDIFATVQGALNIQMLNTIIAGAGTTYAGIAQADAPLWLSNFVDTTTTRLVLYGTAASLAAAINTCTLGNNKPDLVITTRNLFNKVESLVEPQKMYEGSSDLAKAGFTSFKFHDADVVADSHVPAGAMYLLTTDMLELRYHPDYNFKATPWGELEQVGFPNALAKTVSWAGNLVCRQRTTQGRYSALDYTL